MGRDREILAVVRLANWVGISCSPHNSLDTGDSIRRWYSNAPGFPLSRGVCSRFARFLSRESFRKVLLVDDLRIVGYSALRYSPRPVSVELIIYGGCDHLLHHYNITSHYFAIMQFFKYFVLTLWMRLSISIERLRRISL